MQRFKVLIVSLSSRKNFVRLQWKAWHKRDSLADAWLTLMKVIILSKPARVDPEILSFHYNNVTSKHSLDNIWSTHDQPNPKILPQVQVSYKVVLLSTANVRQVASLSLAVILGSVERFAVLHRLVAMTSKVLPCWVSAWSLWLKER